MKKSKAKAPRNRIVIIEDDYNLRETLQRTMDKRYEVVGLSSGEGDIVGMIEGLAPELLVLDVNLPGPDGFELCRRIRGSARLEDIPILFMTARADDESFVKSLDVGGSAYIAKPFATAELIQKIETLLKIPF